MNMPTAFHEHEIVPKILPSLHTEVFSLTYKHSNKIQPGATLDPILCKLRSFTTLSQANIWLWWLISVLCLQNFSHAVSAQLQPRQRLMLLCARIDPGLFRKDDPTGQVRHWVQKVTIAEDGTATLGREISSYHLALLKLDQKRPKVLIVTFSSWPSCQTLRLSPDFQNSPYEDLKDRMGFHLDGYVERKQLEIVAAKLMLGSRVSSDTNTTD